MIRRSLQVAANSVVPRRRVPDACPPPTPTFPEGKRLGPGPTLSREPPADRMIGRAKANPRHQGTQQVRAVGYLSSSMTGANFSMFGSSMVK